jgi:ligand-binding SRPBCC domain-containing protein
LRTEALVAAPAERCFDLARSVDAHAASAAPIQGKAVGGKRTGLADAGDETAWSAQFFGVRFRLTTRIEEYDRPCRFSDVMCAGLFRHFGHVYTFEKLSPDQTRLIDEFTFESPFGPLGAMFDRLVLRARMRAVADARVQFLKRVAESEEWRQYLADTGPRALPLHRNTSEYRDQERPGPDSC